MSVEGGRNHDWPRRFARLFLSPWLYHPFRLFIGGMFLYAGAAKLTDTSAFAATISAYRILPHPIVGCAAVGLPAVEVLAGLGAILNRRWGILAILAMMAMFLGVLGYGAALGLDIDCGCFSAGKAPAMATDAPDARLDLAVPPGNASIEGPIPLLETPPPQGAGEDTCGGETGDGGARLRAALYRDVGLFLGVVYLAAWPGLRGRRDVTRSEGRRSGSGGRLSWLDRNRRKRPPG